MEFTLYNGNWDSTALSVLSKVDKTKDYIAFRCDQYQYVLLQGDVVRDGTLLHIDSGDYTLYDAHGNYTLNGYNQYTYYANCTFGYGASCTVDYSDGVVYSSVDGLPRLSDTEQCMLVLEGVGLLCASIFVYLIVWSVVKHAVLSLRWSSLR